MSDDCAPPATGTAEDCRVCKGSSRYSFSRRVLRRTVRYFECPLCGYLQTELPDWLEEAYARPIAGADTGLLLRNRTNVAEVATALLAARCVRGRVVDHGGGYGVLVRMLRDIGIDAHWRDKYSDNLFAQGFEDRGGRYDLLTAFEVLEHLVDPVAALRDMLADAPVVLVSTQLVPSNRAADPDWWYLAPEYGQHIGFLRSRTLAWLARHAGCHHASDGRAMHLFSEERATVERWRCLRPLRRLAPAWLGLTLESRTMADFESTTQRHTSTPLAPWPQSHDR